jgi:hypothetical protein
MKALKILFMLFVTGVVLIACNEDIIYEDPFEMIPFEANVSIESSNDIYTALYDPSTMGVKHLSVVSPISGTSTMLGDIDPKTSNRRYIRMVVDKENNTIKVHFTITLMNALGDGFLLRGASTMDALGNSSGYYRIIRDYGNLNHTSGWMSSLGLLSFEKATSDVRLEGFYSSPVL